jgi:hypothetical protein
MKERRYYSVRTGKNDMGSRLQLDDFRGLFEDLYNSFEEKGYFQEDFGYFCVDLNDVYGTLGRNIGAQIFLAIRKKNLWPLREFLPLYELDDFFDMIEFLYDHVSKPLSGRHHDFGGCGWHYDVFERSLGTQEFRERVNTILEDLEDGYTLNEKGEILISPEKGLEPLVSALLPEVPLQIQERMESAIARFRGARNSVSEREVAVRELANIFEYLRPRVKEVLNKKDEVDLFELANRFGIRHFEETQKNDYDKSIWLSWMFYYYLATLHAFLRLEKKGREKQ